MLGIDPFRWLLYHRSDRSALIQGIFGASERHHETTRFILLLCPGSCRWLLYYKNDRPALIQGILDLRKRMKGAPVSGRMSILVTDIEGFSGARAQQGGWEGRQGGWVRGEMTRGGGDLVLGWGMVSWGHGFVGYGTRNATECASHNIMLLVITGRQEIAPTP